MQQKKLFVSALFLLAALLFGLTAAAEEPTDLTIIKVTEEVTAPGVSFTACYPQVRSADGSALLNDVNVFLMEHAARSKLAAKVMSKNGAGNVSGTLDYFVARCDNRVISIVFREYFNKSPEYKVPRYEAFTFDAAKGSQMRLSDLFDGQSEAFSKLNRIVSKDFQAKNISDRLPPEAVRHNTGFYLTPDKLVLNIEALDSQIIEVIIGFDEISDVFKASLK